MSAPMMTTSVSVMVASKFIELTSRYPGMTPRVVIFVIPGWSQGPGPESRDSGFAPSKSAVADLEDDIAELGYTRVRLARPGNDVQYSLAWRRNGTSVTAYRRRRCKHGVK